MATYTVVIGARTVFVLGAWWREDRCHGGGVLLTLYMMATVLRNEKQASIGPQKRDVVSKTFRTQFVPPMTL